MAINPKPNPLDREPPATPEQVDLAILWYTSKRSHILEAMPIKTKGATYSAKWLDSLDRMMDLWEDDRLRSALADAYIVRPLRKIRKALQS